MSEPTIDKVITTAMSAYLVDVDSVSKVGVQIYKSACSKHTYDMSHTHQGSGMRTSIGTAWAPETGFGENLTF